MEENEVKLLKLAKECLSIVEDSKLKDKEIIMLIKSAKSDLERVNVDVEKHIKDELVQNTIIIYVKANFGDGDVNKKAEYLKRYKANLRELQFSQEYQKKGVDDNA